MEKTVTYFGVQWDATENLILQRALEALPGNVTGVSKALSAVGALPRRTEKAVHSRVQVLRECAASWPARLSWSPTEDDLLRECWDKAPSERSTLASQLGFSEEECQARYWVLRLTALSWPTKHARLPAYAWQESELQVLRDALKTKPDSTLRALAELVQPRLLKRSVKAVEEKLADVRRLELPKLTNDELSTRVVALLARRPGLRQEEIRKAMHLPAQASDALSAVLYALLYADRLHRTGRSRGVRYWCVKNPQRGNGAPVAEPRVVSPPAAPRQVPLVFPPSPLVMPPADPFQRRSFPTGGTPMPPAPASVVANAAAERQQPLGLVPLPAGIALPAAVRPEVFIRFPSAYAVVVHGLGLVMRGRASIKLEGDKLEISFVDATLTQE